MIKVILDSDLHFKNNAIRPDKANDVAKILDVCTREVVDAVIVPGDLTNNGSSGKSFLGKLIQI